MKLPPATSLALMGALAADGAQLVGEDDFPHLAVLDAALPPARIEAMAKRTRTLVVLRPGDRSRIEQFRQMGCAGYLIRPLRAASIVERVGLTIAGAVQAEPAVGACAFEDATPAERRAAVASAEATEADISAAEQNLRNTVTSQYLTALQAQARAVLQDTLLATTNAQLELARARLQVGSGTQLEVQRAEVAHGQQQVNSLNARNTALIEKVRLFQQMGMDPVADVRLDPTLPETPTLVLEDVLEISRRSNPQLDALRYREEAARHNVSSARSSYLPSLSLQASVSGFTNRYTDTDALFASGRAGVAGQRLSCIRSEEVRAAVGLPNRLAECEAFVFTPDDERAIREQQGRYPFDFTRQPYGFSVGLSLPIFNGFRREQQVAQATVQRRNAENDLRNAELRVAADVNTAYLQYTNAQQLVALQEQNVRTARLALSLAQERYRVGAISLVELVQARGDFERAETDRITSIYDVQRAFAALEAAAGRPLR